VSNRTNRLDFEMQKIHVRKMTTEDITFAIRLTDTMHWDLTRKDFKFSMALEPEGFFVALDGNKKVGIITTIQLGKVGWIGNVIVDPAYRSKGVGAQLVRHATDYLVKKGAATVGLYSYVNTVPFYEKLGFEPDCSFVRLAGQVRKAQFDMKSIRRMTDDDFGVVMDLDTRCMGWSRERLLKRIFRSSRDLCHVACEGNVLHGFIMADWYRQEVGPCVCRLTHDREAVNLLNAALSKLVGVEVRIGVSETWRSIVDALKEMAFKEEFKVVRMYLGDKLEDEGCLLAMESLERG